MEIKLCRPVLVESKESILHLSHNKLIDSVEITGENDLYKSTPQQLILISLDPNEKIEGKYYDEFTRKIYNTNGAEYGKAPHCQNVIATQSQLSPEYIQQFIEEYNKGEAKDVEIEMEELYFHGSGYYKSEELSQTERERHILMREFKPKLTNGLITIIEKSNIEKQADLVEEIAFENLKVKEPTTYTEEEVLECLNNLNDLLEEKQYISNINEGVISTSNMNSKEINELNKREEYIQSITNDNFEIDVKKWFEQNRKK